MLVFLYNFDEFGDRGEVRQGQQLDCQLPVARNIPHLHPELVVEEGVPQLGAHHHALGAGADLHGEVDGGGQGRQVMEVVQKTPETVLRNKLLVTKVNISE